MRSVSTAEKCMDRRRHHCGPMQSFAADRRPDARTLAAFFATVLIGGTNSIAVRVQLRELTPFWGAALRFGIATLVLGTVMVLTRHAWPKREHWRGVVLY